MGMKAYLAGSVNGALVSKHDGFHLFDGSTGFTEKLDGYIFSQLRAIRPEFKQIEYENETELVEKLLIESVQQEALQEALELMDASFSVTYRTAVAGFLHEKTNIYPGLLDFLTNRFYSSPLPDDFNERIAIQVLAGRSDALANLYHDLRSKTEMFDRFYTLFQIHINASTEHKLSIDDLLTESSAFAHFTMALYHRSVTIYEYAVATAIKELHTLGVPVNRNFFNELKEEIGKKYAIELKHMPPLESILSAGKLINIKPYHFFGSPLRTIYNYSNNYLPFSVEQTVQVLFQTHSPYPVPHESGSEFEQRLYTQSLNEMNFLAEIDNYFPLTVGDNWNHADEFKRELNQASHGYIKYSPHVWVSVERKERYAALLYADCTFLSRNFNDAAILYADLRSSFRAAGKAIDDYDHLIGYSAVSVRLGKSYEMLNQGRKAKLHYKDAYKQLAAYIQRHVGTERCDPDHMEDDQFCEPTSIEYVEVMAKRVAGFLEPTSGEWSVKVGVAYEKLSNLKAQGVVKKIRDSKL
ncbi:hypothetical protein [Mucilaginibacter sp. PAMB04168]|uniref:hypothetical protein n=1 Tax=Mucilaginibacter sp. PAMB04168 TaxID=3138567 RepID=UPI0031F69E09